MEYRVMALYVVTALLGSGVMMGFVAYADTDGTTTENPESVDPEITVSVNGEGEVTAVSNSNNDAGGIDASAVAAAAVETLNDARSEAGKPPLQRDPDLRRRARSWSRSVADSGELSHGTVECRPGGENVAMTYWQTAVQTDQGTETYETADELGEAIAEQWLTSDGHRENIMDTSYSRTGIGIAKSGDEIYAAQRLCG